MDRVITTFYKVSVTSGSLGTAGDLRLEPELSLWDSRVSIRTSLATPWLMMLSGKAKTSGVRAHLSVVVVEMVARVYMCEDFIARCFHIL
jgi:hypothetical protein